MTQAELNKILKRHKLWLDTDGEEGKKADLSYADLIGANLTGVDLSYAHLAGANLGHADLEGVNLRFADLTAANLEGTGIYFFKGPRHDAIYNSKDDKLYIGCQVHNLEYWLKNYVNIGEKYEYTDEQIEKYGQWIKSLKEIS